MNYKASTITGVDLNVNVKNTRKTLFSGSCFSVTSYNDCGEFDILPQHANFISLIKDYLILDKNSQKERKIPVHQGILVAKENSVQAFLD